MELKCAVQHYDWGKKGLHSFVAQLMANANRGLEILDDLHYAEMWMGTHRKGPSIIKERAILLSDYLVNNTDAIGPEVFNSFGVELPFMLKVLSIDKPLSIQAHPNKEFAAYLHKSNPDRYQDSNHKPELAIALTPFDALCGFRPIEEIKQYLEEVPELLKLLSSEAVQELYEATNSEEASLALKNVFYSLMICNREESKTQYGELIKRSKDKMEHGTLLISLIKKIRKAHPDDIGIWAPYFLNYLRLQPGEAIFLGPNIPHAYLSGDCIECMACSDNVVRAGLTNKFIDVETLMEMLDYNSYSPESLQFYPEAENENSCVWVPPVEEFAVVQIKVPAGTTCNTRIRNSPSLLIVIAGVGIGTDTEPLALRPGVSLFLKSSRQLTIQAKDKELEIYQAFCNT